MRGTAGLESHFRLGNQCWKDLMMFWWNFLNLLRGWCCYSLPLEATTGIEESVMPAIGIVEGGGTIGVMVYAWVDESFVSAKLMLGAAI